MKKVLDKITTVLLWVFFACSIFIFLSTFTGLNDLMVKPLIRDEAPQKADVIIILGGGVLKDTRTLPWGVVERIQKGVELYKQGIAPKIIVTGGLVAFNSYAESEIMAPYVRQLGVPTGDVIEEDRAKDTYSNALYSHQILEKNGWAKAIVVTSDFHTQRACHVFRQQEISITCAAAHKNPSFDRSAFRNLNDMQSIIREYAATIYYWLKGYI